ncbi:MAG: competence type IV pilus assembly protein ComGB [Carnobacterium jeotgali]|uniref:competence type IV pilus assembly protein ComGB n=1 Tax=Carnobacterium jeotgali TaxID=545534 RepID=UPI000492F7D1|nr:competence type IV pilus assembly protein ComGB [Carnobacterium jeotgali]
MVISVEKILSSSKFPKKKSLPVQASFLIKLSELMTEGFSLKEALLFLKMILPKEAHWIQAILEELENGERFDRTVKKQGFSERVSSQIYLAFIHGNLTEALAASGNYLEEKTKQQSQLTKLLQYPLFLLLFMIGILMAIRYMILPNYEQMNATKGSIVNNMAIGFVYYFPAFLGISSIVVLLAIFLIRYQLGRQTAIQRTTFFMKIPIISTLLKLYYTNLFSYEWSQLLKSGHQMNKIIELMQSKETTQLMQEVAHKMEKELRTGRDFKESMNSFPFFNSELGFIIMHGEATSRLGTELAIYANDCQLRLTLQIQKIFSWIQPIIFLVIAFFIMCVYLALLLPTFTMMEEIL